MRREIQVGDQVKYRREFLQSTGQYTGCIPFARGTVTSLKRLGNSTSSTVIACVDWGKHYDDVPAKVNVFNLTLTSNPEVF
jgi:hypothetical protein